ncbi:MAG TPA: VWA domain-containing protein [Candidatus Acidoferrum sp.]|jgi:VWFA-related protein
MSRLPASRLLFAAFAAAVLASAPSLVAQSQSSGPIAPQPGTAIQQPPQRDAKIGVSVALVNTPITVRDNKGNMIHTLDANDFQVTDNGVPQRILHFDMGGDPLSVVVLVETSARVAIFLPQISKAGILITQTVMGETGEAAVIGFNDSVDKLLGFTHNADKIENAFTHLQPGTAGVRLYDAMTAGIEMLSSQPQPTSDQPGRRRVMLIISEATDVGSGTQFGEVLRQAQLANITIYSVGLSSTRAQLQAEPRDTTPQVTPPGVIGTPPMPGTVNTPDTAAARLGSGDLGQAIVWAVKHAKDKVKGNPLELAAAGTGGEHVATFKDRSIDNAIDQIGGELHSQYSASYAPTGTNPEGYHEIKVSLVKGATKGVKDSKDWKIRNRPGYYVGPPES